MVCKKCGKETLENMNFCGYCGSRLVEQKETNIIKVNGNQLTISRIKYIGFLVLSLMMVLFFLGNVSYVQFTDPEVRSIKYTNTASVKDYMEASFETFSNYTYEDLENDHQSIKGFEKIKVLKMYMVEGDYFNTVLNKYIVYFNTILMITTFIVAFLLIGLSIYKLIKFTDQYDHLYKRFLNITLILGFILYITTTLMGHHVGTAIMMLIILSLIGLIFEYIMNRIKLDGGINTKSIGLKITNVFILIILFFLTSTNITRLNYPNKTVGQNYGHFALTVNQLNNRSYTLYTELMEDDVAYAYMVTNEGLIESHGFVTYGSLIVSTLMVIVSVLIIASLLFELNYPKNRWRSMICECLAFVFEIITIVLLIIIISGFNDFYHHDTLKIGYGLIFLTILTLLVPICRMVIKMTIQKIQMNNKRYI